MKTWKICVEDGPHQYFYVETRARTLDAAIRKVYREIKRTQPWLSISIFPSACSEIERENAEELTK